MKRQNPKSINKKGSKQNIQRKAHSSRNERERKPPPVMTPDLAGHREEAGLPLEGLVQTPVVSIFDIAFPNNYGVGKLDGFVLFVPGAVPQDIVRVEIAARGKKFGYGKIVNIEEPSPLRIEPPCPHFGICGGCTLQNLTYDSQLAIKENYLRQTLKRLGNIDAGEIDMLPIVPSPGVSFYRTKLELAFGEKNGRVILGLRERVSPFEQYSSKVVPLRSCEVFSPLIEKIIPIFTDYAHENRLIPYNPITHKGFLRHLIVREAKSTGELMFILETTTGSLSDTDNLWQKLTSDLSQAKSLYSAINNGLTDVIRYEKTFHIGGNPFIEEKLGGFMFHIHPQSFFQPNAEAAKGLYEKIPDLAGLRQDETMLGLYCGTGAIEIFLSPFVKKVIGIDSLPQNITNAIENCRINGRSNCSFHAMTVENLLHNRSMQTPDILILDPPRAGITLAALKVILQLRPAKIVYISCNPSTLARDLKYFRENRYRIQKIVPHDFFPHTSHLETLVYLHDHNTNIPGDHFC